MLFTMTFVVAVVLTAPFKSITDTARDEAHLNCDASNVTTGTAAGCIIVDLTLPFFLGVVLASAGALITKTGGK